MEASSVTSQGMSAFTPMLSASGRTRRSMLSRRVNAISAPWEASTRAMPQAMESLLATPMTTPRLPAISVPDGNASSGDPCSSAIYPHVPRFGSAGLV